MSDRHNSPGTQIVKTLVIAAVTMAAAVVALYLLVVWMSRTFGDSDSLVMLVAIWGLPIIPVLSATIVSWLVLRREEAPRINYRRLAIAAPMVAYVTSLALFFAPFWGALQANVMAVGLLMMAAGGVWGLARSERIGPERRPAPPDGWTDGHGDD